MSARQRRSRVEGPDGWTTISSRRNRRSRALMAHQSDLAHDGAGDDVPADEPAPTEAEIAIVTARLQKQIAAFNESSCCAKLKELVRSEVGSRVLAHPSSSQDGDGDAELQVSDDEAGISNVLIIALGSLSESFSGAPGHQLAAALTIIDVLRELNTASPSPNQQEMQILSYDPVYTAMDKHILSTFDITPVPASKIPHAYDSEWYRKALVYMPHGSVWLNHDYFIRRPRIWIGNSFTLYDSAMATFRADEAAGMPDNSDKDDELLIRTLREAEKVAEEYRVVDWPDAEYGGGQAFNNVVVYVREHGEDGSTA